MQQVGLCEFTGIKASYVSKLSKDVKGKTSVMILLASTFNQSLKMANVYHKCMVDCVCDVFFARMAIAFRSLLLSIGGKSGMGE